MSLLKINGVAVQATASEWQPVTLGEMARTLNGAPRSTARVRKADLRYTSGLLMVPEAHLLRALVLGDGDVLSFDDDTTPEAFLYTSRCVFPVSHSGVSRSTVFPWRGIANLRISAGGSVSWAAQMDGGFTVMFYSRFVSPGASAWNHVAWNSSSGRWYNGINFPSDPLPPGLIFNEDDQAFGFTVPPGQTVFDVDDVVILPFAAPDAWMPALFAFHETRPWPALPYVLVEDPRLPAGGVLCLGEVGPSQALPLRTSVAERVEFTLYGT
ncbi:MAG TPA: hypothetical protein VFZ09_27605 [Archangium sp.]|uniref:hypothetical protein n=1 Tax=Archangium sp. TaxID=1872627 RepID=UPI002E373E08|nr:hypothetical protein [Archangium sp.]HEX5750027.1 hypothetical protein [Archangium sp.]